MTDVSTDRKMQRDRSPAYPAIPLEAAIERLIAFEKHFKKYPAPLKKAGQAWEIAQADYILAALKSFGLIEYQGPAEAREVVISEDGRTYLKAQQESLKQEVLRRAALRPKSIAMMWEMWGADRPANPAALDTLMSKKYGFSERGAPRFLKVYDATIAYAGLVTSDKIADSPVPEDNDDEEAPLPPGGGKRQVQIMDSERELTAGLLSKSASFRLIVTGTIGAKEIERLIAKLELDKEILADSDEDSDAAYEAARSEP